MKVLKAQQTGRFSVTMVAVLVAVVAAALWGFSAYADGSPTAPYTLDVGYLGPTYGPDVASDHTASRPESKLWWNDGFWWATMWNDEVNRFHIYRLDWGSQTWGDTGVPLDSRPGARADVLWNQANQKLYVASHDKKSNPTAVNDPLNSAYLYRFSYDQATDAYTLDDGFPVAGEINQDRTNTVVIDKDTGGRLWASYVSQPNSTAPYQVYVNASDTDDANWQTPFSLLDLFPDAAWVAVDDISSIVAFNGTVGVMWTNQRLGTLNFALHDAASPMDAGWTHTTAPIVGTIDDHLSLKANSAGQLFAAIKTNAVVDGEPLIAMVTRDTDGSFAFHGYSPAEYNDTRPTLLVDEGNNQVYIFVTGKPGGSKICYKTAAITAPLANMAFAEGNCGTDFIADAEIADIDSATTSKHSVNNVTGLVVLASDDHNGYVYVHNVIGGPPPVVTVAFSAANYSVDEDAGTATIDVSLNIPASAEVSVNYATSDGTATAGSDYTATNGTLTFAAGETSKTFTVPILDDALDEDNETVNLVLSNPANGELGLPNEAVLTIVDDEGPVTVQFQSASFSVFEGEGGTEAEITVSLNRSAAGTVTVDYATMNGTSAHPATAGSDYTATSGTLTFAPSETSITFTVPILDDALDEPNETVNLVLSNPTNSELGLPNEAVLTIVDDDDSPSVAFDMASYTVNENQGTATITVELSASSASVVTVDYATSDGTATAGSDYTATSGTLTFAAGETNKTFTVPIVDDALDESNETVNLTLSSPSNAMLGTPSMATLTIVDNDPPAVVEFDLFLPIIVKQ